MSTEAPKPAAKGWRKALFGTVIGLCSGAFGMYFTTWFNWAVKPARPIVNFSIEQNGLSVVFTDHSTNASKGRWDFGDGTPLLFVTPDKRTVEHTYKRPGTYTAKLICGNLLNDESERVVVIEVQDTGQKSSRETALVDVRAKAASKSGDLVIAPATFQFEASADNAQMFIWDFGDGSGFQIGEHQTRHTFAKPGEYRVRVCAFNGKAKDERELFVRVAAPPADALVLNVRVTDSGTQVQQREREIPVSQAATIDRGKGPATIEQVIPAGQGWEILALERKGTSSQNLDEVRIDIASDRKSVKIIGQVKKGTGTFTALLSEQFLVKERAAAKTVRDPLSVRTGLPTPGRTQVRLPDAPEDWTDLRRDVEIELIKTEQVTWMVTNEKVLWKGKDLPRNAPVLVGERMYSLTATPSGDRLMIELTAPNVAFGR